MKIFKKISFLFCSIAVMLMFILPNYAYADDNYNKLEASFKQMLEIAENSEDITDKDTLELYKNLSKNTIKNKDVKINAKNYKLDFNNLKAVRTTYNYESYNSIYIPI